MSFYSHIALGVFDSKEALVEHVKSYGHAHGFHTVIQRSKEGKVVIQCDKGGKYRKRVSRELQRNSSSKKTDCPFKVTGVRRTNGWQLEVHDPEHNHEPALSMRAHAGARTMTPQQLEAVNALG